MNVLVRIFVILAIGPSVANAQNSLPVSPCSHDEIIKRNFINNPGILSEIEENEVFCKAFNEYRFSDLVQKQKSTPQYIIPVVLHVFHNGNDGKIDLAQAQSGIDILNNDFNGLNSDFNSIDPAFDSIKATLDIQFCLASIDPAGNSTTGLIYYEDSLAMLNIPNLFQYAWDNTKYLNIYLPKYTNGAPSLFTAYAYYPSTTNTNNNTDGIFYSSVRWGYGNHSELTTGQEWVSVGTHETGHWLNLRHTFENGCSGSNDNVNDTPPTTGGTIELSGCYNNDFSCGVATNGENYMDYNHDCKKMFTQGQVSRMTSALYLPSRINLWSASNLVATGCLQNTNLTNVKENYSVSIYPNPAESEVNFRFNQKPSEFKIYNIHGQSIFVNQNINKLINLNISELSNGIYFYIATFDNKITKGKFIKM
jgi:hypothetical protein